MKRAMKKFTVTSAGILLLGCAAGAQADESVDPNLTAAIQHQAAQAQANIQASILADLHADAQRHFADLLADAPLVLAAAQPGAAPHQAL